MIRFFTQAFKNYRSTGALAPSSRFLARTIVQSIPEHSPKRMLEVGCGTGAFTKEILNTLRDGDSFHIVELNPEFCKTVEATVLKKFREGHPDIEVIMHNAPIEEANLEGKFDAIICGLPFNNFPVEFVQHLFQVMLSFLKKDCELAYFEYLGMRGFKSIFGFPRVRRGTKIRTTDIDTRYEKQAGSQQIVWRNFPSCRVVRLKKC
ncbi:MAG TPA: methyltransferase domain-containing protein [Phycisphaerales bacterium]|nr:methyltransferase domain-containing protein [Phycisphaerales bacterium]